MSEFHDGDTSYHYNREGIRLAGANASEMATVSGDEARDAAILAKHNAGVEPTGLIDTDLYGREVRQMADAEGNTLGQALVNTGMASPMSGKMALGVNPTSNAARELLGMEPQGIERDAGFQFLAEQARAQRLEFLDKAILSGAHGLRIATPDVADPEQSRGVVDRAWDRGVDNMQGTFYGFADALGSITGINALEQFGEEGVARNIWEALASPASVATYEDIDGLADAGVYALEALVEFAPQIGLDVAAAIGTGGTATLTKYGLAGIGKAVLRSAGGPGAVGGAKALAAHGVGKSAFTLGAQGGAFASMYAQSAGETQNQLVLEGVDSPETALAVGLGKAALDYAGLSSIISQGVKGLAKGAVAPDGIREILGNTARAAGVAATAESLTEATQTLMDEMAIMSHKPEYEVQWNQVIDAMLKGGIAGGGIAGAGRATTDVAQMVRQSATKAIPADSDPLQATDAEPLRDIEAQIAATPEGEGNWYTSENAAQAKEVAAAAGKSVREGPDGGVFVGSQELVESLPEAPTQADAAKFNGYAQTKEQALADPEGAVVVESRTADGAVLRNQLVGKSIADAVRLDQQRKFPDAVVEVKQAEAVIEERKQAVAAEKAPEFKATGKLAEQDVPALFAKAQGLGIDPARFQQQVAEGESTLGEALPERLSRGLKAQVTGGVGKRLDSVKSLAPLLDIPANQLERSYYDSRNVIQGRDQLHKVVEAKIREKFGSAAKFAEAVNLLPLSQAESVRQELGMTESGGFDVGRLVAEIEARSSDPAAAAAPAVDLDSTPAEPNARPAAPADRMRDAVFNTPAIRQIVARDGSVASVDQIDEALEGMSGGQRVKLETMLRDQLGIDQDGPNHEAFLALLQESVAERAVYGIGRSRVDDTVADGEESTVGTVTFDPSALDSEDARLVQLVAATPLGDRAKNGWPAGLSLYMEALARIVKAGEAEEQSALSDAEAVKLNHARALGTALSAAVSRNPTLDLSKLLGIAAEGVGVTAELIGKASGGKGSDVATSMAAMVAQSDPRLGRGLLLQMSRIIDTDAEATPGVVGDNRRLDDLGDLLESGPEMTVKAMRDALQLLTHGEPVEDMAVIGFYAMQGDEKPLTASAKGRDAGHGDDVAIDAAAPLGEQKMSDDTFFAAVRRASITAWDTAVKPTPAQLKTVEFKNAASALVTKRFGGENLLVLPASDGNPFGSVVDAVALAMYAQAGEGVPSTPGEAAANLLENLSRLMAGPQNSNDAFTDRAKAVVRVIPDDLVIFVDPVRGTPVTFGQGLNHRHAFANANARQTQIRREMDDAVDRAGVMAEALETFARRLWADTVEVRKNHPLASEAVSLWLNMLAGEKTDGGEYHRKPTAEENAPLRRAMDSIGKQKVEIVDADDLAGIKGKTLDAVYTAYLSTLGRMKALNTEATRLSEDMGAKREAPTEEAIVAAKIDPDREMSPEARERATTQALRGGQRTAVLTGDPDSVDTIQPRGTFDGLGDPEYNPYGNDPLAALSEESWYDADDRAQEAAIEAWLKAEGKPALFRKASTRIVADQPAQGMTADDARRVAEEWLASYGGNVELELRVGATQEEVYGGVATDQKHGHIKGSYQSAAPVSLANPAAAQRGKITLVAAAHTDAADVRATMAHEILGHYGLNTLKPGDKRAILDAILASKSAPGMRAMWADIAARYPEADADTQAEEVFAFVAEQPETAPSLWTRVIALAAKALRAIGVYAGTSRSELEVLVRQIGAGIRDGRAVQRNFPQTTEALFRRAVPSAPMLIAQGKQFWNKGVLPKAAPIFSMVYSRIERLHPQLAKALFQPAGTAMGATGRSWEQSSRALKGRMLGQVDRVLGEIRGNQKRAAASLAVQAAFEDAYTGSPKTANGIKVRRLVDNLLVEAQRAGLKSVDLGKAFAPVAFDRQAIAGRTADFQALLLDSAGIMPDEAREIISRIVDGPGVIEGAIAPGMPVGTHRTTKELVDAVGAEQLMQAGWLLPRHDAALFHWVDGVAKRASWEAIFGGEGEWKSRDGKVERGFDPNAKFKAMLDDVRKNHGDQGAQDVLALVNGALGRHPAGQSMPGWWRSTQDFITGWVGMTVLAFSGIASIPELALPLVRANGRVGIGEMMRDFQDAKRFARDMGVVLSDVSEQVMWQTTGDQYRSPAISKMQSWFFRLNGNELIVRTSRTLATGVAVRYLMSAAADGDAGSLQRLGLDAGTVLAWDQAGRPTWSPDLPAAEQALAAQVSDAVSQFVNEATLNPSKFQSTHWGNNPYMKMIWHLKHFLYTYGDTVLGGMWREMKRRWGHLDEANFANAVAAAAPALIFAVAVLPLAAASLEARDWLRRLNGQQQKGYEGAVDYLGDVFSRAGGLGPAEFLLNMRQQQEWGASVFGSIAPTFGKVDMLFSDQALDAKLRLLTPIAAQNKGLWPFD